MCVCVCVVHVECVCVYGKKREGGLNGGKVLGI